MNKLFEIQKKIGVIKKDKENDYYKSLYFDINSLLSVLKPLCDEQNVMINQPTDTVDGHAVLKTIITDVETGKVLSESSLPLPDTDPQKLGSAITYYRRYMLQALFALEAEDDDANMTVKKKPAPVIHTTDDSPLPEVVEGGGTPRLPEYTCPVCGQIMVAKKGKFGLFYGCPMYPECNGMRDQWGVDKTKK